jgi:hypothetical protein
MYIFPHLLIRIAAMPYESLGLATEKIKLACAHLDVSVAGLDAYKQDASSRLLGFNQGVADKKAQQTIQNIRKKIFQLKMINDGEIAFIQTQASDIQMIVDEYILRSAEVRTARDAYRCAYLEVVNVERENIRQVAASPILLKGLAVGSHTLYQDIAKYRSKEPSNFKGEDLQVERAILKYLTRIVTKTTPFSTFTHVGLVGLKKMKGEKLYSSADIAFSDYRSYYRMSAYLMYRVRSNMMQDPALAQRLPICLNQTLTKKKNVYSFVTYRNGTHDLRTVNADQLLVEVVDRMGKQRKTCVEVLTQQLSGVIDAPREEIQAYLLRLLTTGIFEFDVDIDLTDTGWINELQDKLTTFIRPEDHADVNGHLNDIFQFLARVRATFHIFPKADAGERILQAKELRVQASELLNKHANTASGPASYANLPLPPAEQLIFEDTGVLCGMALNESYVREVCAGIGRFYQSIRFLDLRKMEMRKMYEFYMLFYPGRREIPFIEFYETYFREIVQPGSDLDPEARKKHVGSFPDLYDKVLAEEEAVRRWKATLVRQLSAHKTVDELHLDQALIDATNEEWHVKTPLEPASVGLFIQPVFDVQSEKGYRTVVNAIFGSHGKMFSRFLDMVPRKVRRDLKTYVKETLSPYGMPVEINDPSNHNANLYPRILDYELRIPGAKYSHSRKQQIPLGRVVIKRSGKDEKLYLYDKDLGQKLLPVDFGFQNVFRRMELFRFIHNFTPVEFILQNLLFSVINDHMNNADNSSQENGRPYKILPRIVYERTIVMQRKTWIVQPAGLPRRAAGEDEQMYFIRVREWTKDLGLPDQVFIRRARTDTKPAGDDYKPQFIDLYSPSHVTVLEKIINRSEGANYLIEEALPQGPQGLPVDGKHFASEFFVQFRC